jgi:hypothetical protein
MKKSELCNCRNCEYFDYQIAEYKHGECRRERPFARQTDSLARWPLCRPDDWCGEWVLCVEIDISETK